VTRRRLDGGQVITLARFVTVRRQTLVSTGDRNADGASVGEDREILLPEPLLHANEYRAVELPALEVHHDPEDDHRDRGECDPP
jgi:hypothetical protein